MDVLDQAMEDAEDEIRTALLERYRPEQLPATGEAPRAMSTITQISPPAIT